MYLPGLNLAQGITSLYPTKGITMQDDDKLLTAAEVSKYLGVTDYTLHVYRMRGTGPLYMKIGRCVRYRVKDVREWVTNSMKKKEFEPV